MFYGCILPRREQLHYFLPLIPEFMQEALYKYGMIGCVREADASAVGVLLFEDEAEGIRICWCAVSPDDQEHGCALLMLTELYEIAKRMEKKYLRVLFPQESYGAGFRRILERLGYTSEEVGSDMYSFTKEELDNSYLMTRIRSGIRKKAACLLSELVWADRKKVLKKLGDLMPAYSGQIQEETTAVCLEESSGRILAAAVTTDLKAPDVYLARVYSREGRQKELMKVLIRAAEAAGEAVKGKDRLIYFAAEGQVLELGRKILGKSPDRGECRIETRRLL